MSDVSNDNSVKERSHTSENKLHLDPEGSQSILKNLEKFSVKNVMELDRGTMKINANELIPAEVDILKNEMDLSQSENIHSVESESDSKALENVDLYNDNSNKLNNSQKLAIDKANVNSDIADVSLKDISTKYHDKADKKQRNVDNTVSETHGSQSTDANIYCDNFCIVTGSQEISEIYDSIKSCVDAILDDVCVTEKENELVNIDFIVKNKEKLEALSQELSLLNRSPVKSQMKKENNCDIFQANHVLTSEEKPQNFIKPLNTEINKSGKQNMDACCNSEKDNFQSMIVDIVMKAISIDNGKSGERAILEPETQEHENSEANVKGENSFVSDYKGVVEINDDVVSCVDMVLENLSLTKEKNEMNDDFVVSNRETPEEINHKLRKLDKSLQKDQMKGDNCDTFGLNYVISSAEKQENFIEPLNTEINNSGKQNIHECCNLEKDNYHSMNVDIVLKDISEDNGGAGKKGITELQTQEHENREDNIRSGDSCFIKIYKELTEINDDVKSCVDTILENLSLTKKNVELINGSFVVSNSEKSQEISQELSKLGRNLKEDQIKADNYDAIRVNHAISSEEKQENFIEPLNTEINNSVKQNSYECCNLDKDNFHAMNVDIVMKDISKDKREADITESESQEHENRENNINSGDNCFIDAYKVVIEINKDVKSCVDMILENLSLTEGKVELINDNFAVNNGEKSEKISQQLGKLVIRPQENQMKANNCDAYGVIHTISSQENFIKPLNTEINNSGKEDIYACCYSENGNFHSMDGDVVMTDISEDNGKEGKRDTAADITKPETQKHEKGAANVNSVDNCFINKYIAEINGDVRSCADKILQNLNLTEKDTEINDDFTVTSKELMEKDRQELSKLGRSFQKTEMKGDNSCDINSDVKCKLLDTEINSYSIDVNLKDISTKDFKKGNHTENGIDETEIQAHEQHNTEDNIYSGKSNVIISNGGVGGKSDIIKLSHPLLEIQSLTENGSERNNIDLVISSSETSEKNSQELNKLGRSLQDDQAKVHSCDLFGVNHVINSDLSFSKPLDAESNDSHVQSIDSYSYSKKDFNSGSFKYIIRNDCRKADHINRGSDNVETEAYKQDIEVSICSGKSSVINSNRRVSGKSDDFKLSDPHLGIATLTENESKSINVDFNANDNEKSEKITQESKLANNLPKDPKKENNCDSNSDINFSKRLDTEITDSHAQGIDLYSNSEKDKCNLDSINVSFGHLSTKDCRKTDHISRAIDNAETETFEQQKIEDRICCSKSSVIKSYERVGGTSDDTKSSLPLIEIASLTENELIHVGFIANSEKTEAVCQELNMLCGSTQKDETKIDNNCMTLGLNHANSPEEKHKDLDNALDTDTNNLCKQNTDVFNNPEKENSDSVVDVNLKTTSLKDQGRPSQSENNNDNAACETLKHQRTKASTCSSIVDRIGAVAPFESKSTHDPEDSEVIIIYDSENEHFDYKTLDENSNDLIGKKNNIDVQSQEKFNEELDNKLEILKAQYSDIESTLVTASESFSLETLYKFIAKIKKELTSCVQSSEKLRVRFRNKSSRTKLETSNVKTTPSCSYKQPEEPLKTPFDKYRYRSQACTKLHTTISNNNRLYRKVESHHFVEYNSAMFPRETVQTSHRCRQSPEHFSSSENETCNNLHKKKCKSSHYSYERKSKRFNEDKGLDKCCLSKNSPYSTETIGGRSARDTKKHGYSCKMGYYAKVGGFSKSSFVYKGLKSPRNYIPYSSRSNPAPGLSSPNENYSILKPHCYRKKVSEGRKQKDFKSPKYGREYDFNSDSSDSLQISSDSDRESTEIHSDHYYDRDKYYNRTPKWIKKEKVSSGSRKRKYNRNGYSTSNSDSSVQEVEAPFEKRHDKQVAYEWDTENKRVQGLINRQMDIINKHVSRKDDLVKFQESAFIPPNIAEKDKRRKYSNRKKFSDDEISSANDMPSIYENQKKRKNNASEPMATPYKLSKVSNRTDVHSFLKNKYNSPSPDAKLRSSVVAPSPHSPVLSEESDRRTSYKQAKARNRVDDDIFENTSKYNIKSCKAQLQSSVVSPSRILISPVKTKRRRNDKEIDSLSLKTLRDPVQEYSEIKMSNLDNRRRGKIWNDAVQECRNVDDQEWSENEINNVKDMQSYVSFLKKKKGSYTNMELLLKDPIEYIWPKSVTNDESYVDTHRENKHKSGCNEELVPKTKLMQKSPEKDSMYPENSSGKVKKTVRVPKIYSEMTEESLDERTNKRKPMRLTQMSNSKKKPVRLPRMSSEVVEQSEIERPTKKKHVRISPFSSEMTEQSFIENPSLKKSPRISRISSKVTEQNFIEKPKQKKSPRQCSSPVSSEITEQSFIEKPAKKKPLRISPISWEVTEKSLIQKPAMKKPVCIPQISSKVIKKSFIEEPVMKKPMCMPQITSKVTEKRSTQKPAKKKPVEDEKDSPVFNRSLDLFKQLNREIGKKKVTKHTPVSSKASSHDVHSKYQD